MKLFITTFLILVSTFTFASVKISKIEFDNLYLVQQEISKKFPKLTLTGSKEKIRVYGMDEKEFLKELKRLNIQKILDDKEKAVEEKKKAKAEKKEKAWEALKESGMTIEQIENLKILFEEGGSNISG